MFATKANMAISHACVAVRLKQTWRFFQVYTIKVEEGRNLPSSLSIQSNR
nr:MAG TPA: hypothetical protein [Caudoviricetes sp.]